jgi:integrase
VGKLNRLTLLKVHRIARPGRYADGGGLYLEASAGTRGSLNKCWVFRYQSGKRERWMGLGSTDAVTLAGARAQAADARSLHQRGVDPLEQRKASKAKAAAAAVKTVTFDECAAGYIGAHETSWRNPLHAREWRNTLARYASLVFGKLAVGDIDRGLVLRALEPIWHSRPETAGRVRGRIERILDFAEARGYRPEGSNPARLLPIKTALGRRAKTVKHFAALAYGELPAFMAELRKHEGVAVRALEFLILTASRTGEVLGARWSEIDVSEKVWTLPAERMKSGKQHRVPLSEPAIEVLRTVPREQDNVFVFIGMRGKGLGHSALLLALRSIHPDATAHGMRSSFTDWATERTNFPREVVEMALAHVVGSKVEEAYRRADLLEKRRLLMAAWSKYCAKAPVDSQVPPLVRQDGAKRRADVEFG